MFFVLFREPRPDVEVWTGRRTLALIDAVGWPVFWIVVLLDLPKPGIFVPVFVAVVAWCALRRAHRALWANHRYWFTTWRWGKVVAGLLFIGMVMKLALLAQGLG